MKCPSGYLEGPSKSNVLDSSRVSQATCQNLRVLARAGTTMPKFSMVQGPIAPILERLLSAPKAPPAPVRRTATRTSPWRLPPRLRRGTGPLHRLRPCLRPFNLQPQWLGQALQRRRRRHSRPLLRGPPMAGNKSSRGRRWCGPRCSWTRATTVYHRGTPLLYEETRRTVREAGEEPADEESSPKPPTGGTLPCG